MPAIAAGFRRARPPLVPGQPSAFGRTSCARTALGVAAPSAHRNRVLSDRADVANILDSWDLISLQARICPTRIFPKGVFAVSEVAGAGSHPRRLGLRRHHGSIDPAKAARLDPASGGTREPAAIRRSAVRAFLWIFGRDISLRADSSRHDDFPVQGGGRNSAGTRFRNGRFSAAMMADCRRPSWWPNMPNRRCSGWSWPSLPMRYRYLCCSGWRR